MHGTNSIKGINVQQVIIACTYVVYIPMHVRLLFYVDLWTRLFRHITNVLLQDGNKSIFLSFVFVSLFVLSKPLTMDNVQKLSDSGCDMGGKTGNKKFSLIVIIAIKCIYLRSSCWFFSFSEYGLVR